MVEPLPIAEVLSGPQTDMGAAAVLVALVDDPDVEIDADDLGYLSQLEARKCVADGVPTPLSVRVSVLLERMGIKAALN